MDFPEQVAIDGTRIPTLAELLHLIQWSGNELVRLNIETKSRPVEPEFYPDPKEFIALILKVARDEGFMERITIQSFDWRALQETQRQAPNVPTEYCDFMTVLGNYVRWSFINTKTLKEETITVKDVLSTVFYNFSLLCDSEEKK